MMYETTPVTIRYNIETVTNIFFLMCNLEATISISSMWFLLLNTEETFVRESNFLFTYFYWINWLKSQNEKDGDNLLILHLNNTIPINLYSPYTYM